MSDPILLHQSEGPIATLTLNNPAKLNVLSDEMLARLQDALDTIAEDANTRVVILKGAGKAFCAGHDLREMTAGRQSEDGGRAYFKDLFTRCSAVMTRLRTIPQPVIAQAHGIATAAGCQLVASCDMATAADDTKFGVNGVNIGLFCSTPMVALSRNIPTKQAFEMLVTGEFIDADRACALGLVNRVCSAETLDSETNKLASLVASKLGQAVKIGKRAFYDQAEMSLQDAYAHVSEVMVENMLFAQTEKGISAFLNKEETNWDQ